MKTKIMTIFLLILVTFLAWFYFAGTSQLSEQATYTETNEPVLEGLPNSNLETPVTEKAVPASESSSLDLETATLHFQELNTTTGSPGTLLTLMVDGQSYEVTTLAGNCGGDSEYTTKRQCWWAGGGSYIELKQINNAVIVEGTPLYECGPIENCTGRGETVSLFTLDQTGKTTSTNIVEPFGG